VRRAKDNCDVPKRYYRPEQTTCPRCGRVLRRCYPLWRKYVVFLDGRYLVVSMGYRCPHLKCAGHKRVYASQGAGRLAVRGSSFALEVVAQIGYWRFWKRWTVAQIHDVLTQECHLPISEREVLYLIGVFLVLLRCTYRLRLVEHAAYFHRHGLFLAVDALKPEKGNRALYVVRELKLGLVLQVTPVLSAGHQPLAHQVLQPVKALGYRIRGVVSDDEQALQVAVAQVFPDVRHQTCQVHCLRDAATPIVEADQACKKALKQAIRTPFYAAGRALSHLAPEDPCQAVLSTYAELIRSTLTEGSKPPFALGGLRVFADLARLEASLKRSQEKGAIPSWRSWWLWSNAATHLQRSIAISGVNGTGWLSWSGGSTRRQRAIHAPRGAVSNDRSRTSWRTWKSMPGIIPTTPRWSRISAPPSGNAGRGSLRAMAGPNVTAPTTIWKPSLAACARASAKFTAASQCTNSSFAMASGLSSLIPLRPLTKCYYAFNNLTKPSSIGSIPDSAKPNDAYKCCISSAITPSVVSSTWNSNGLRLLAVNFKETSCRWNFAVTEK
jgi:mutator family transposase